MKINWINRYLFIVSAVGLFVAGCSTPSTETFNANASDVNGESAVEETIKEDVPVSIEKTLLGNPIAGSSENLLYGGDPSVLVDGDTVYLYTGRDASTDEEVGKAIYNIPEYLCYSSKDMVNWNEEGVVMKMDTVSWASNDTSAWAAQVMKHFDKEQNKDMYYLYFCTWEKTGKQGIGVATSDSPVGPFTDIGEPLVRASITKPATSSFNDIDPTAWIETDEDGTEHRYLAWGNGMFFVCELNEDMISVKDVNGDDKITSSSTYGEGDILIRTAGLDSYTEAPWLYRRQDENGNYFGDYYLFFAHQWRECMAYATTDDLLQGEWSKTTLIMNPTTTSNTNHMAVCDFKGETYFIYHNGSLPKGNGYRRSACIRKLQFNDDGSIDLMEETSAGLGGVAVTISTKDGKKLSHANFINTTMDSDYPYGSVELGADIGESETDSMWVIRPGKADYTNENCVSIESENKSGLYITGKKDGSTVLSQDTKASDEIYSRQSFITVEGLGDKEGVSFKSVQYDNKYLAFVDGKLCLTDADYKEDATFYISTIE